MSWIDEENQRQAARMRRQAEWDEQHQPRRRPDALDGIPPDSGPWRPPAPQWPETEWPDPAGFSAAPVQPYPAALAAIPPESGQPAAVLLAAHLARRSDPLTIREETRAAQAVASLDAGTSPRLDGREALRRLAVSRNPDGGNLSGTRAREIIRQLGIAGVGHEPGCAP